MHHFATSLRWAGGQLCRASSKGKSDIDVTPPPEFGGTEGPWTPEDLLVSAVETCILLTTLSVLQRQKISLTAYESSAVGHMEKLPEGLRFSGIDVAVTATVSNPEDAERLKKAIGIAEKYCPVSNALKCPVRVTADARV